MVDWNTVTVEKRVQIKANSREGDYNNGNVSIIKLWIALITVSSKDQ